MGEGTGACGINCMVCGLFRQGKCSPCASGTEPEAHDKLAAQLSLIGAPCPILQCAVSRQIAYCSADCDIYPCRHFMGGPYPLSEAYLQMQVRRRGQAASPSPDQPVPGDRPKKLH